MNHTKAFAVLGATWLGLAGMACKSNVEIDASTCSSIVDQAKKCGKNDKSIQGWCDKNAGGYLKHVYAEEWKAMPDVECSAFDDKWTDLQFSVVDGSITWGA